MNEQQANVSAKEIAKRSDKALKDFCFIGVFTAIICVLSQISIPMPAGVPMTLQTLIIPIAGIILDKKRGTYATLLYLLIGAVGLPVFSGFSGGIGKLFGITGGFLISFPILSFTAGLGDELGIRFSKKNGSSIKPIYFTILVLCLLIGATINYVFGTLWFMIFSKSSFIAGFTACVLPFIPTAVLKIVLVALLAPQLKKRLSSVL
ncbi:biotin transporter BioY [Butyrivibrio sp. VCD2006]|uniref:biotin transporter BioY n=1 Tax=Butyrivibrio sp. VCD2006 TaxID=1280664 RepID=UPI000688C906|nr:biotin transporter BioY [Butyrivibrio sp. VCD2006]